MRIELTIEVLQTSALPLGYRAPYAERHAKNETPAAAARASNPGAGDGI